MKEEISTKVTAFLDSADATLLEANSFSEALSSTAKFTRNEDVTRTAMLFCLGYLYENRSNPDYHGLTMSLRSILFAQREGII